MSASSRQTYTEKRIRHVRARTTERSCKRTEQRTDLIGVENDCTSAGAQGRGCRSPGGPYRTADGRICPKRFLTCDDRIGLRMLPVSARRTDATMIRRRWHRGIDDVRCASNDGGGPSSSWRASMVASDIGIGVVAQAMMTTTTVRRRRRRQRKGRGGARRRRRRDDHPPEGRHEPASSKLRGDDDDDGGRPRIRPWR